MPATHDSFHSGIAAVHPKRDFNKSRIRGYIPASLPHGAQYGYGCGGPIKPSLECQSYTKSLTHNAHRDQVLSRPCKLQIACVAWPITCTQQRGSQTLLRINCTGSYSRSAAHRELLPVMLLGLCGWQRQRQARSHFPPVPQGVHSGSARTLGQAPAAQSCQHCARAIPGSGPPLEALSLPTQGPALGQICRSISRFCSTTLSR